mmetsp:Transcript_8881/g.20034  ORF Transcript_8881/g.20034 Transcript_8881/m.20034 type:complete len:213 (+) Transcript_8881:118-756(+)
MAVEIGDVAYAKLMLHLVRHPHAPVCGFLVGRLGAFETGTKSRAAVVDDAVPLFHGNVLAPMLEVATQIVAAQLESGQAIVGFYHVNELAADRSVPIVAEQVASTIEENQGGAGAVLLQVINEKLSDRRDHALQAWARAKSSGTWSSALEIKEGKGAVGTDKTLFSALRLANTAVECELFKSYADFDDHLENPERNPFNPDTDAALRGLFNK